MTDALLEIAIALAFGLFPAVKELPASLRHCLFGFVAMAVSSLNGSCRLSV
jgi:hypothetical protein